MKIAVVGLGLIGGSFALSLKKRTGHKVLGMDIDPRTNREAVRRGAVDELISGEQLCQADITLIALPPGATLSFLREHAADFTAGSLVADFCGVKQKVVEVGEGALLPRGVRFLGAHPMAGKEKGGFIHASADLFCRANMVLTPTERTDPGAVEILTALCKEVGFGRVMQAAPKVHDRIIAFTSQLCHAVSGAYIQSPQADLAVGFTGGSYEDFTRVAEMDADLWSALFLENRENLLDELSGLRERLRGLEEALRRGKESEVSALLAGWSQRKKELKARTGRQ